MPVKPFVIFPPYPSSAPLFFVFVVNFPRRRMERMIVEPSYRDIHVAASPMRTFVAAPRAEGRFPGILCYSDIFQLTGPMLRASVRLAGYGFVVAAPEIYHRIEPPGTVIPFDEA